MTQFVIILFLNTWSQSLPEFQNGKYTKTRIVRNIVVSRLRCFTLVLLYIGVVKKVRNSIDINSLISTNPIYHPLFYQIKSAFPRSVDCAGHIRTAVE